MKKARWRIKDLIDLEYFLSIDEKEGDDSARKSLAKRDRDIYLKYIQPLEEKGQAFIARFVIRSWLEQRRNIEKLDALPKTILPGEAFLEIHRLLGYGFLIMGLLTGSGLAFSFLNYKGIEPLNVSAYLGGVILIQIFLLLLLMGVSLIRMRRSFLRSSVIYSALSGLLATLTVKIKRRALKTVTGSKRGSLEGVMGLIKGKGRIYGSLFYWPVFVLAQIFGIAFNLGVLCATLLKVIGSDIALGWQSTVQFSTQAIFELVHVMALPWSWFVPPEIAHPSLSQIEGSRMVLKDGIYHLATEDLVSWWPFLCFAVLAYGLLPRVILLIGGLIAQNRALGKIDFDHSACERLLHRLGTPLLSTVGSPVSAGPLPGNESRSPEAGALDHEDMSPNKSLIALVPDDIFEGCPDDELAGVISRSLGYQVQQKLRFGEDEKGDQGVLDELSRMKWEDGPPNVLILQEAWQPPIKEILFFIRDLRKALGETSKVHVGLIGRPITDTIFTRVKDEDWRAWHQKIEALGDPYLRAARLMVNGA